MLKRGAGVLAARNALPTSVRAVLGYFAETGVIDYRSLRLKSRVDATVDAMIEDAFTAVEAEIAEELGRSDVSFSYDTKLVLPAKLSLGYLYRRLDSADRERAEAMTRLVVEALIDGDMRDAINDDEFEDFGVGFDTTDDRLRTIASLAQRRLQNRVDDRFGQFPERVRGRYRWAVSRSEQHQERDPYFRRLLSQAETGDARGRERVVTEYKFAEFEDPPEGFTGAELDLPYIRTQYNRVGVIYDGMIGMYRGAEFSIEDAFRRSIILAIIGAQIWLDDIADYRADRRNGQLTPVTAEYLVAENDLEAREAVVDLADRYLDRARQQATVADSTLTGIAVEYIARQGDPTVLPDGTS